MALLLALLVLSLKRSFATGRFKCTSAVSGYWKRYYNDALVAEANQHPLPQAKSYIHDSL